jgi:protein pelota
MKVIEKDLKRGKITLKAENSDDLWCISTLVEKGDVVSGKTWRKIKLGGEEERKSEAFKKELFLSVAVEDSEFHPYSAALRISGKVCCQTEDVPAGAYHTFSIESGSVLAIEKKEWLKYQIERIESFSVAAPKILVCIFDREEAHFYLMQTQGYEKLLDMKGEVEKKRVKTPSKNFYLEISARLSEYNERIMPESIILASPAFWKEYLLNGIKDDSVRKKSVSATVSSVDETAMSELVKRPELSNVLKRDRLSKEEAVVSALFERISKALPAEYGISQVKLAGEMGAVEVLLVSDRLIQEARRRGEYSDVERIMSAVESANGKVTIIASGGTAGIRLDGLGGIGALLRYRIN